MSTRATIHFNNGAEEYFVYRHCDGYPEIVRRDIDSTIKDCLGKWTGAELGQLVSYFIGKNFDKAQRIQSYELTECFHGDESYRYTVKWNEEEKKYTVEVD